MAIIEKHYKITNWCQYEDVDMIESTVGMLQDNIASYRTKEGHLCSVKTWLSMAGNGWEIRTFTVEDD